MIVKGIVPPLVSPLNEDGTIDVAGTINMIDHCIRGKADGIFLLGSCGEGSVLAKAERKLLIETALKGIDDRVPLLVGVLETSAKKVVEEILNLEKTGVKYFVVTPPYYLSTEVQGEILEHFRYISKRIHGKLIVYNIPSYVHSSIYPETMMELLSIDNVISVKDSTGDWGMHQKALFLKQEIRNYDSKSFMCGNEDFAYASLSLGADGCVPCFANAYPELYSRMQMAAKDKNTVGMVQCQKVIGDLKEVLSMGASWIGVVKYLCSLKGLIQPYTGDGLPELTDDQKREIRVKIGKIEKKHGLGNTV